MSVGDIADDISGNGKTIVITSSVMLIVFGAVSTLIFFISLKLALGILFKRIFISFVMLFSANSI